MKWICRLILIFQHILHFIVIWIWTHFSILSKSNIFTKCISISYYTLYRETVLKKGSNKWWWNSFSREKSFFSKMIVDSNKSVANTKMIDVTTIQIKKRKTKNSIVAIQIKAFWRLLEAISNSSRVDSEFFIFKRIFLWISILCHSMKFIKKNISFFFHLHCDVVTFNKKTIFLLKMLYCKYLIALEHTVY